MSTKLIINPVTGDLSPVIPSSTNLGRFLHTRSSIPPINPNFGDTFEEVTSAGDWVQSWFWNGTYWLSLETKKFDANYQNVSGSGTQEWFHALNNKWDIFITDFYLVVLTTNINDSTRYWKFELAKRPPGNNNLSILAYFETKNLALNSNNLIKQTLNLHLPTASATLLNYRWTSYNNPSPIEIGSASTIYRFARL